MPIDDLTALGQKMWEAWKNKELTELSEKFETNWASEWNLTILSLVLFIFGEKRQAIHSKNPNEPDRSISLTAELPLDTAKEEWWIYITT